VHYDAMQLDGLIDFTVHCTLAPNILVFMFACFSIASPNESYVPMLMFCAQLQGVSLIFIPIEFLSLNQLCTKHGTRMQ
jgi:hypothetical protein